MKGKHVNQNLPKIAWNCIWQQEKGQQEKETEKIRRKEGTAQIMSVLQTQS